MTPSPQMFNLIRTVQKQSGIQSGLDIRRNDAFLKTSMLMTEILKLKQ